MAQRIDSLIDQVGMRLKAAQNARSEENYQSLSQDGPSRHRQAPERERLLLNYFSQGPGLPLTDRAKPSKHSDRSNAVSTGVLGDDKGELDIDFESERLEGLVGES